MTFECAHCHALHYLEEKIATSSQRNPLFSLCCSLGKVQLPDPTIPPREMLDLFITDTEGMKAIGPCVEFH